MGIVTDLYLDTHAMNLLMDFKEDSWRHDEAFGMLYMPQMSTVRNKPTNLNMNKRYIDRILRDLNYDRSARLFSNYAWDLYISQRQGLITDKEKMYLIPRMHFVGVFHTVAELSSSLRQFIGSDIGTARDALTYYDSNVVENK